MASTPNPLSDPRLLDSLRGQISPIPNYDPRNPAQIHAVPNWNPNTPRVFQALGNPAEIGALPLGAAPQGPSIGIPDPNGMSPASIGMRNRVKMSPEELQQWNHLSDGYQPHAPGTRGGSSFSNLGSQ